MTLTGNFDKERAPAQNSKFCQPDFLEVIAMEPQQLRRRSSSSTGAQAPQPGIARM